MSKGVKNIAKIAATAAAVYYGGAYLKGLASASSMAGASTAIPQASVVPGSSGLEMFAGVGTSTAPSALAAGGSTLGGTLASAASGLLESKAIQAGGMAMQGLSSVQQSMAMQEAQAAEKKRQENEARFAEADARRNMIQSIREQRILAGRTEATAAGRGFSPQNMPSSVVTGLGALGTQTATNVSNIAGRAEFAKDQARAGTEVFTATNEATGWSNMATLGGTVWKNANDLSTGFKNMTTIFS